MTVAPASLVAGAQLNQSVGDVVSSGDGLAVVVGQAFVDLDGEGDGAVVVLDVSSMEAAVVWFMTIWPN